MSLAETIAISSEFSIHPDFINALRGEVSNPVITISHKTGPDFGKMVTARLAINGPGMFGLADMKDSKEWSGITNHYLLTGRYAVDIAHRMEQAGYETHPQMILNAMIVSHAGRRQSDEAHWYYEGLVKLMDPKEVYRRGSLSNETLGMQLIEGKVPQDAFELVVALGHNVEGFSVDPSIYSSLDFLVAIYIDHRTAQKYDPLNIRMGDFLLGNFFAKDAINDELRGKVYEELEKIIGRERDTNLAIGGVKSITLDEADQMVEKLGAQPDSIRLSRKELMRLILQDARTEAMLLQAGIIPDEINDTTVPMPKWEDDFRLEYVTSASDEILTRITELQQTGNLTALEAEFPPTNWWGKYARKLYEDKILNNNIDRSTPGVGSIATVV